MFLNFSIGHELINLTQLFHKIIISHVVTCLCFMKDEKHYTVYFYVLLLIIKIIILREIKILQSLL